MKTTYYLVTATAVAVAALTVYAQLPNLDGPPLPTAENTVRAASASGTVPPVALPPISTPPDEPLVMPGVTPKPNELPPLPTLPAAPALPPVPAVPPVPVGYSAPAAPPLPSVPSAIPAPPMLPSVPVGLPAPPAVPLPVAPPAPLTPIVPLPAASAPKAPIEPLVPPPVTAERPVQPLLPPPAPLPAPTPLLEPPVKPTPAPAINPKASDAGVQTETLTGQKYVVLKEDKVIEGSVTLRGDVVLVRQGALDRAFAKSQVQFVADSKDDVYKFMLAKVTATDTAARLKVARWCMFSGMREQALAEAREIQKIQPGHADAAALARSLELSLQQFPPDGAPKMAAPATPVVPTELSNRPVAPVNDPEPDVSPEAANLFATRVQPFLANQCTECHAKADFAGKFKLARVAPGDTATQVTRTNLRAVAGQLRKDEPVASPFLLKTLTAHGGQKLPSVASRQAVAYQTLEAWTALAVGTPIMGIPTAPPMPPMPVPQPVAPVQLPAPSADWAPNPPMGNQLPPAVPARPVVPSAPLPPPVELSPVLPPVTTAPPVFPPVPQAPAVPAPPSVPVIPPAEPLLPPVPPAIPPVPKPALPPIPPAGATLPPLPVPPMGGSQFGSTLPPKAPASGPTAGDEFDPSGFNQGMPPK